MYIIVLLFFAYVAIISKTELIDNYWKNTFNMV